MVRFFPAAGYRHQFTSMPAYRGGHGWLWASSAVTAAYTWVMYFNPTGVNMSNNERTRGFPVRCVAQGE